jgi:glycosyltransferase involved in cell wall biosynthesis
VRLPPPIPPISFHPQEPAAPGARFTIVIPTWNNLPYARLCLDSIRRNSAFRHQVVLHVNDGSDGTLAWARREGLDHTWSRENAGICFAVNAAASLGRTDHVVYMNDDMYVCPGWDAALWRAIEEVGHPRFFVSATAILPRGGYPGACAPHDFGDHPDRFREAELLAAAPGLAREDWSGASWPPNVVHRSIWDLVGGLSVEFSPGLYSDPDFSMKLWAAGVRHFRGVGASKVYHFEHKSTSRLVMNDGRRLFSRKWGVPTSFFYRRVLRMGQPWRGPLGELERQPGYGWARLRALAHRLA